MKDLLKLASGVSSLPVPLVGFLVAVSLLFEKVVSFDQALVLIFVSVGIHFIIGSRELKKTRRALRKKPVASLQSEKRNSLSRRTG